jgi:hypothetical protein
MVTREFFLCSSLFSALHYFYVLMRTDTETGGAVRWGL